MSTSSFKSIPGNKIRVFLVILLGLYLLPVIAQDQPAKARKWEYNITPYLLFPYMNGDVAITGIPVDVNASPDDIFSNLNFGAMLYFEASSPKWALVLDALYMDLSKDGQTPLLSRDASVGVDQLAISISGRYRINEWVDVGIGGRINSIGSSVRIAAGDYILPGTDFSMNETWFDPFIVARAMTKFNDSKWRLGISTDIGGFGIGSDFAWQINPFTGYQFTKLFQLGLSYRWLGMKYETGSGTDRFLYDVTTSGPELRLSFTF